MAMGQEMSFDAFLNDISKTEYEYVLPLRSRLRNLPFFLNIYLMIYEQMHLENMLEHCGKQTQMHNSFWIHIL